MSASRATTADPRFLTDPQVQALIKSIALADGAVNAVVAGTNVTVDSSDPANPIVSATGGGSGGTPSARTARAVQIGGDMTVAAEAVNFAEIAALTGGPGTGGLDLTIAAVVNDVLEITLQGLVFNVTDMSIDIATIVSAAAVNWIGQSAGSVATQGLWNFVPAVQSAISFFPISISAQYVVVSGDISGGNVVVRPMYYSTTTAGSISRSAGDGPFIFGVKNLKH